MHSSPLLFLHGAGVSNKNRTKYLQDELTNCTIESFSFDFIGHGQSSVKLSDSSLKKRVGEAKEAIKHFNLREPLNVCGSSMGAYIAITLLTEYQVGNLILFCPAVYDRSAFNVPFTEKFSQIIKKKDSWKNSDSFSILNHFGGKALIFIGEKDEVIPKRLVKMLDKNLIKTLTKEIITIPDCSHAIHQYLSQNSKWRKKVVEKICELW